MEELGLGRGGADAGGLFAVQRRKTSRTCAHVCVCVFFCAGGLLIRGKGRATLLGKHKKCGGMSGDVQTLGGPVWSVCRQ